MINCDQIAAESARLKTMFAKCYNLKAIDLRSIVDLIESVSACSGGSFNLKTINGQSLLGVGDLIITAVVDGTETKVQQGLGITVLGNGSIANPYVITNSSINTADGSETKINEGANITIAGTGTIADPYVINADIPSAPAQVNADWSAISGPAEILNKPEIPAIQVNSDWNSTSGLSQILNKPEVVTDQDNSVRVISIVASDLSGIGDIKQQICDYVLLLPDEERTILETDSKWNIQILENAPVVLRPYDISTISVNDPCAFSPVYAIDRTIYYDGTNAYPVPGDSVYLDMSMAIALSEGYYTTFLGGSTFLGVNSSGKVISWTCPGSL